jgi:hypothetical protein
MIAGTGIGRILTTKGISPVQSYARGAGSLHDDVGYLSHERTLGVGHKLREKGGGEQEGAQSTTIVVVEQWICFVLGLICMAFGIWGICMNPGQHALSAPIAWLGSLYMPVLRVTAVVCIGLGAILARRGWTHL